MELPGSEYGLNIDDILLGKMGIDESEKNSFVGYLQNFYFDQYKFFDYFLYGGRPANIRFGGNVNATISEIPFPIYSVTFRRSTYTTYLVMPMLQFFGDTSLQLMFKTSERDGLLLYNGGHGGDFFAMALANGALHVSANDGGGARHVTPATPFLSDNRWHLVEIVQTGRKTFSVTVDRKYTSTLLLESPNTLDLYGSLYIGGVPENVQNQLPSIIPTRKSFIGCLASLHINSRLYNLVTDVTSTSANVIAGCSGALVLVLTDT